MASCSTYELICPFNAIGDECTYTVACCDGVKTNVILTPENIQTVCVEPGGRVVVTSLSGSANPIGDTCTSSCGDVDPSRHRLLVQVLHRLRQHQLQ